MKQRVGMTLVEILVTLSIVAVISTLAFYGVSAARQSMRDARRKADMAAIRDALEIYRSTYYAFPVGQSGQCDSSRGGQASAPGDLYCKFAPSGNTWSSSVNGLYQLQSAGYINLPIDPLNDANHFYIYKTCANGGSYALWTTLEGGGRYLVNGLAPTSPPLLADLDNNGVVNTWDSLLVVSCFSQAIPSCVVADFNDDGLINAADVNFITSQLGKQC